MEQYCLYFQASEESDEDVNKIGHPFNISFTFRKL